MTTDPLIIANKKFTSRLFLGTGKYSSPEIMKKSLEASETEIVTTALRRVDIHNPTDSFLTHIDTEKYLFLPNTSGARDAEEAIKIAKIAKFSGVSNWIKLEVTPEPNYLMPDPIETLKAAEKLVKLGFIVLPYIHADPILAKRLEEIGCATVMPLAAPIGTNMGIESLVFIEQIIEQSNVPVVIDAGIGAPSHAIKAMEIGADAILVNTAIATSNDPILIADSFKEAVIAGRKAYKSGLPTHYTKAEASSPLTGFLN